jgi:hypothetical protein
LLTFVIYFEYIHNKLMSASITSNESQSQIVGMALAIGNGHNVWANDVLANIAKNKNFADMTPEEKSYIVKAVREIKDAQLDYYNQTNTQQQTEQDNSNVEQALSKLKSTEAQKHIATTLKDALSNIDGANRAKIAGLNADIMTAKRIGTIHSQNLIQTRAISDSLKLIIVFACFAVIVMFLCTKTVAVIPLAAAEVTVLLLTLVCTGILISRWLSNMNRYNMLTQERVFEWQSEEKKADQKRRTCTPDEDG